MLTLHSCGHAFHSKCLSTWFLIDRFDCPVCRAVYYQGTSLSERAARLSLQTAHLSGRQMYVGGL